LADFNLSYPVPKPKRHTAQAYSTRFA
jgi:hypothetical protein